ncbi:2-isopropylmalate synthase [Candidatus Marinamargulisbacteria bacterium SCGC AG-439-L15]|nr:2-isopropylmalate synthase [Candidatus Marinamargulisbacteria bacterium SCGC AG-439-L15]
MNNGSKKYIPYPKIDLPNRQWPNNTIQKAPIWCSVDLRDGNQALINPMTLEQKLTLFETLVTLGFKEIEVGFPSAAEVEFQFLRTLVEKNLIPEDVTIQVLCQCKEPLIKKTFDALKGVKKAIFHLYNSTSIQQRKIVFRKNKEEIKEIAIQGIKWIQAYQKNFDGELRLEYSPESFTGTEVEYSLEICNAVLETWGLDKAKESKVILNLPATVELSTPNIYADLIEWFSLNLKHREHVIISLHTHNDRGTGIAATELGLLAGADRVEGTLFGNGERTGNVDIITLALNMYTQGVNPELDISTINELIKLSNYCTDIPIHPRHPYAGELVYTAFSGSHQDAIKKGMAHQKDKEDPLWEVPYLPIDPEDVGRTYEAIIRINSQSGKGGSAYIMEQEFGCILPKAMHPEFGKAVQKVADQTGEEISSKMLWTIFNDAYLNRKIPFEFTDLKLIYNNKKEVSCKLDLKNNGSPITLEGSGNGPIDACKSALSSITKPFNIVSYHEHSLDSGSKSKAIAYIQIEQHQYDIFGVGIDENITIASIKALLSALNRLNEVS